MNSLVNGDSAGARRFPDGFLWGVGTSSYQVEGGVSADGRGRSIWDVFTHTPGMTFRGDNGDVACDSYHRLDEDLRILGELGVGAYRFSVSWSRVLPDGSGAVNQAGLDYYRRLVAGLRERGIKPVLTVYHWDLPQALEERGGWGNRDTASRLAELGGVLASALGDQVAMWITLNEPLQTVHQGYRVGTHAPGRSDAALAALATHNLLLAHGLTLQVLRAGTPSRTPIGVSLDPHPYIGLDDAAVEVADTLDAEFNHMYLQPLLHGGYPSAARAQFTPPAAVVKPGDLDLIRAPLDFLGVNYYRPHRIRSGDHANLKAGEQALPGFPGFVEYRAPGQPQTVMGWPVVPDALCELLVALDRETGGLPLYITENGCAADDYLSPGGTIDDYERIEYTRRHLGAALDAIDAGVKLAGYFHWSLMDNFEWAHGYRRRFGLYYVAFESGRRIAKRSAGFYAELIRSGRLPEAHELSAADPTGRRRAPVVV